MILLALHRLPRRFNSWNLKGVARMVESVEGSLTLDACGKLS